MFRLSICVVLLSFVACGSDETPGPSASIESAAIFPLSEGLTTSYQVNELIFSNGGNSIDTFSYQLQEVIVDQFRDETDATVFVVDRFIRSDNSSGWTYNQSWQSMIANNRAIRIEDNVRFIKFRLPITVNDTWDGNALFDDSSPLELGGEIIDYYKNWQSTITRDKISVTLDGVTYNNVYEVTLVDYENSIEIRRAKELYAEGIGLISRSLEIMDTQCFDTCAGQSWEEKAEKGHIYTQTIINI